LPLEHPSPVPDGRAVPSLRVDQPTIPGQQLENTVILPSLPIESAKEPNDSIYNPTPVLFGSSIKGKLTRSDLIDWYVFKTLENAEDEILVIYRFISSDTAAIVHIDVYDADENRLRWESSVGETKSIKVVVQKKSAYFIKVATTDSVASLNYELSVRNKSK
jgi:hypothetical protein